MDIKDSNRIERGKKKMYKKVILGLATSALLLGACSDKEEKKDEVKATDDTPTEEVVSDETSTETESIGLDFKLGLNEKEAHKAFGGLFKYDKSKIVTEQKFSDGRSELYQVDGYPTRELVVVYNKDNDLMFTSYMDVIGTEDGDTKETKEEAEKRILAKFNEYVKGINGSFDEAKLVVKEIGEGFFVTYYKGDKQTFIFNKEAYDEKIDIFSYTFYANDDTVLDELGLFKEEAKSSDEGKTAETEPTEKEDKE